MKACFFKFSGNQFLFCIYIYFWAPSLCGYIMASQHMNKKCNGVNVSRKSSESQNEIEQDIHSENTENGKETYNVENDPLGKILASFGLEVTEEDKFRISKISSTERSISTDSSIYIRALYEDNNDNYCDNETVGVKNSKSINTITQPVKRGAKSKKVTDSLITAKGKTKSNCKNITNSPNLSTVNMDFNEQLVKKTAKKKPLGKKVQTEILATSVEEQRIKVIEGTPCQRTRSKKSLVQLTL